MKQTINVSSVLKDLTKALALTGVLSGFASQSVQAGKHEFLPPQQTTVESYAKKMLVAPLQGADNPDALVILPWEIDDRGQVPMLNQQGKSIGAVKLAGKGGMIAVRLVDRQKTNLHDHLVFQEPQYLMIGDSTSWCGSCEYDNDVVVKDMDGDGYDDIVALNSFTKTVTIFWNDSVPTATLPGFEYGHFYQNDKVVLTVGGSCSDEVVRKVCHMPSAGDGTDFFGSDHPFRLAVGDFNGDGSQDIAVEYLDNYLHDDALAVSLFLNNGRGRNISNTSFKQIDLDQGWWATGSRAKLSYSYGSPYYTVDPNKNENGSFQLMALEPTMGTKSRLLVRSGQDTVSILEWDGQNTKKPGLQELRFDGLTGPLGVLGKPYSTAADLLVSRSGGQLHELTTGSSLGRISSVSGDAFVGDDFDLDGVPDFARVSGNDLVVGYGDGVALNAFATPSQYLGERQVNRPWKYNQIQMVTGNFFNIREAATKKFYRDIAVLGQDIVTIWPNANKPCDFGAPGLNDIQPMTAEPGGQITLRGGFSLNQSGQITAVNLRPLPSGSPVQISYDAFVATRRGTRDEIDLKLPANLASGAYQVSVQNVCRQSSPVQLTIRSLMGGVGLTSVAPRQQSYGKTLTIIGKNFLNRQDPVRYLHIIGSGQAAGVVWHATERAASGQFQIVSDTELELRLPSYQWAFQNGVSMLEGTYDITIEAQSGKKSNLLSVVLEADKPIITHMPHVIGLGGALNIAGQGFKNPDMSSVILTNQDTSKVTSYTLGNGEGSFSWAGQGGILVKLPSTQADLPIGTYKLRVVSDKGVSEEESLVVN